MDKLEKRVKSRFSQNLVYFEIPQEIEEIENFIKKKLKIKFKVSEITVFLINYLLCIIKQQKDHLKRQGNQSTFINIF